MGQAHRFTSKMSLLISLMLKALLNLYSEFGTSAIGVKEEISCFALPAEGAKEPLAENGYALDVLFGAVRLGSLGKIKAEVLRRFSR